MKTNQIKSFLTLVIALSLLVVVLPLSTNASATSSAGIRRTPPVARTATSSPKENNLRAKLQARDASPRATSTRLALNSTSTKAVKLSKTVADAIVKADKDIVKRIDSLNNTLERVAGMKNISSAEKSSATSDIQSEINKLTTLKSKIDSDTDLATIKTDTASIIAGSRIYALVIPRINILASADKINVIATMLETISVKLQTRIDEAKASSTDVTALQKSLDTITTKTASAKQEALTAQATVSSLVPDNGDKTILDSNNADLKSARANIKTGNQDLKDARKSAKSIIDSLKTLGQKDIKKDIKLDKNTLSGKSAKKATTTKAH